jgi:hypothetical protein
MSSEIYESILGHLGWGISTTYIGQHNTEKRRHISMPRVGFETTIPVLKIVCALDGVAIGTGTRK